MLIIWFIWILFSLESNCLSDDKFIPDLTLLSRKNDNIFEYICVAGNNVRDSALIFNNMISKNEDYMQPIHSAYRTKDDQGKNENGYDCDFDNSDCSSSWLSNNLHEVIDSENSPLQYVAPVLDERWEKFEIQFINPNSPLRIQLNTEKSFSFSLRSKNISSILLYNSQNYTRVYCIKLNPNITAFMCKNQDNKLDNCIEITTNNKKVNLKTWQHFTITFNDYISIFNYDTNEEKYVVFPNKYNIQVNKLEIMQDQIKHNSGFVKIHKYNYLSFGKSKSTFEVGQQFKTSTQNNAICIEFYALTCANCSIQFSLDENTKKVVKGNLQQRLQSWQYVKLFVESSSITKEYYRLKVENLHNNSPDLWAIDDIRRCRNDEYRIISKNTTNELITCQSLKYPSIAISKKNESIEYKGSAMCNDKTQIGSNCSISCGAITNERYCHHYTICETNNEKKSVCACVFGYYGRYCEKKIPLPYLRDPLILVNSTINSLTVRLNNTIIEEHGPFEIIAFGVEYKEINTMNWISTNKNYSLSTKEYITILNLKPEVVYSIRGILYTSNDKFNQEENIKLINFKTVCKNTSYFIENLIINTGETNATVTWNPICNNRLNFEINCDTNKINTEWCAKPKTKYLRQVQSLTKKYDLQELSPFSRYELIIKNENNEINSTYFITKPSAKHTAVQNLTVFARNTSTISIRWKPPQINESISYYQRFYKKCNNNVPKLYKSIANDVTACDIWSDWLCNVISGISSTDCYQIYIQGFYNDREMPGHEKIVEISPDKASSPPENIKFDPETSSICWNHPNFILGQLKSFHINIVQINSTLLTKSFKTLSFEDIPQTQNFEYCNTLNQPLELSSTYEIRIQTKSSQSYSDNKHLLIDTEPITPELMNDITIGTRTNTTQEITIPQITPKTITLNSIIFVQICNEDNTNKIEANNKKFDNLTNCNGLSWIAAKFTGTNKENNFTIGDSSKIGDEIFIENTSLNQSLSYTVYVILINEYKGQERYKIYSRKINYFQDVNNWNPLFLLLLLLLFIPIIAFFVYKKSQNKFIIPSFTGSVTRRNDNSNFLPLNNFDKNVTENPVSTPLLKTEVTETILNSVTASNRFSRVVKIENLSQYVKNSLENGELQRQHELLKKGGTKPWEYGMMKENMFKNRYKNLTAYDHSRVILKQMRGDSFSDFINANYIDGYKQKNAYIATQGPKINTINDFWRMIWQENVKYIVMLANLTEGGKKKCEKYWPEIGVTQEYVNLSVIYLKSDIYADFEYRTFEVTNGKEKRMVQQLHFTSWPDHGVPLYPQALVPFLRKITSIPVDEAPIVVHCSAGVGRTGTIILTDICLRMAAVEGQIDALKYLHTIRENRANMVDNFNQYKLVHMVLLEYLLAPETNIPCNENMAKLIENLIETGNFQTQFDYLEATAWHNKIMTTNTTTINPENYSKNRFPLILPGDTRIYISRYPYNDENSDYINAIPVDGFLIKDQFIVTQNPLPNTIKDFWRMVNECNCKVIVSLNDFELNDESCSVFWPTDHEEIRPMPHLIIKHKTETNFDYYDVIKLQMTNQNAEEGNETSSIKLIQFKRWKRDLHLPQDSKSLISLFEEAHSSSRGGNSMIVTCYDGTTACGVFVALSFVIEKIKLEQICDVSLATRVVRCNRQQFIMNWDQYIFLYKAALEYVNSFEEYANFQGSSTLKQ